MAKWVGGVFGRRVSVVWDCWIRIVEQLKSRGPKTTNPVFLRVKYYCISPLCLTKSRIWSLFF